MKDMAEAVTVDERARELLGSAVEQARAAIVEYSGDTVGEYIGVSYDDDQRRHPPLPGRPARLLRMAMGRRRRRSPGRGPRHDQRGRAGARVRRRCSRLAWVPWEERVRPGDLGAGDLLAPRHDDPRLVPGYTATGDPAIDDIAVELGLGRRQVLSEFGRADAAQRWHDGDVRPAVADGAGDVGGYAATAPSTFRSPGCSAGCSGSARTRCLPTATSSTRSTAAARTPTHLRQRAAAHPAMSRSTTACSIFLEPQQN